MSHVDEDLQSILKEILKEIETKSCKFEFRNYTPYMGGDAFGNTFHETPNGMTFVGVPSPYSIIGRMRWLSRLVLASFVRNPNSYADIEKHFQIVIKDPPLKMGVIEFMFGTLKALKVSNDGKVKDNVAWSSPYHLSLIAETVCEKPWDPAYRCYQSHRNYQKNRKSQKKPRCEGKDRYQALLVRGDMKDGTIQVPLDKNCLILNVTVYERPRSKTIKEYSRKFLPPFLATLVLTPTVFGLGKATSRGFGRFKLINNRNCSNEPSKLRDMLSKLQFIQESQESKPVNEEDIKELFKLYLDVWSEALSELGFQVKTKGTWIDGFIPAISSVLMKEGVLVTKKSYGIDKAMDKIGEVVTKVAWKQRCGQQSQPGVNYHTWTLGLPRNVGNTGYLVSNKQNLRECNNESNVKSLWKEKVNPLDIKAISVRRRSPFEIFPLPNGQIVVLAMPSYDLNLNVDFESPIPFKRKIYLYHVGKHRTSHLYHIVKVLDIVNKKSVSSSCGRDEGGIKKPDCLTKTDNVTYKEIFSITTEWLRELLE